MMEALVAMLWRLRTAGEDKNIFCVKFSFRAKFRARSANAFRCSHGHRPRLLQLLTAPFSRLISETAISSSCHGGAGAQFSSLPSEKSNDHPDRIDKSVRQHRSPKVSPGEQIRRSENETGHARIENPGRTFVVMPITEEH